MLIERVLVAGHHHPREQQGASSGYNVHLARVAAERLYCTAVYSGVDSHEVDAFLSVGAYDLEEVLSGYLKQILVKVADRVVHRNGAYHSRRTLDELLAESVGLAVVGKIHYCLRAELYRHVDLLHFHGVVLAVAGNAQVNVDLGFQPGAYALGGKRRVVHVGRDSYPALSDQLAELLRLHVFLCRNGLHFRGDYALLCGFHLCFVFSHVMSFPETDGKNDPWDRVRFRYPVRVLSRR